MRIVARKPPAWVIKLAREASDLLTEPIRTASDYGNTKQLMAVNHRLMQMFGYFRKDEGFTEFKIKE
jgi:hypothetical protein